MVIALALIAASCVVRGVGGPRITGTCDGACAHYVECKAGHLEADRARCTAECPQVFADRDSLRAYESLTCQNAVEYIDGTSPRAATSSR